MASADVGAEGNGDGVTRLAEGEHDTRDRGHAAGKEKRPPTFQLAEHALDLGRERMVVALVGEATELAVAVGSGGRAIESGLAQSRQSRLQAESSRRVPVGLLHASMIGEVGVSP